MSHRGKGKKKKQCKCGGKGWADSYLKGLRIPILDLFDGRHLTEAIWQFPQVLNPVGEANGKLLGEELRCAEESACWESEVWIW